MTMVRMEIVLDVDKDVAKDSEFIEEFVSESLGGFGPIRRVARVMVLGDEVEKELVVSTRHMPSPLSEESEWYMNNFGDAETEYGYRFPIWSDVEEMLASGRFGEQEDIPEWFIDLVRYAERVGATFVNLDRDGLVVDGLREFDW